MSQNDPKALFDISGMTCVMTGGSGVLGASCAKTLAAAGAKIALMDIREEPLVKVCEEITAAGGEAIPLVTNVLEQAPLEEARDKVKEKWGRIDALLNYAGGNRPDATAAPGGKTFFELPKEALSFTFDLNLLGTVLPCQVFGKDMAEAGKGNIINVSSMAAFRPLTRVIAYSASKAGISNFTQWLSVHMAQEYNPNIRVNAIAPGFLLTDQNRYLLTDKETGERTERGQKIIDHTPQGRYGEPEDLNGAVVWLLSPASEFVTGAVVPIDGGFAAFAGV